MRVPDGRYRVALARRVADGTRGAVDPISSEYSSALRKCRLYRAVTIIRSRSFGSRSSRAPVIDASSTRRKLRIWWANPKSDSGGRRTPIRCPRAADPLRRSGRRFTNDVRAVEHRRRAPEEEHTVEEVLATCVSTGQQRDLGEPRFGRRRPQSPCSEYELMIVVVGCCSPIATISVRQRGYSQSSA